MHTFKDNEGREWQVVVNIAAVKRVKSLTGIDMIEPVEFGARMSASLLELVDVLYAICKPQADSRGVTDEQFGEALAGDSIETAANALIEEYVDFFPKGRRTVIAGLYKRAKEMESELIDKAMKELDANLDEIMARALQAPGQAPGGSSSPELPQSSALTPIPSPVES